MQNRLPLVLIATWLAWPAASAVAQPPHGAAPAAREPRLTRYVSLVEQGTEDQALEIRYPWVVHHRPSVEVRLVTGGDARPSAIRPLWFLSEHLKGEVTLAVYRAQDEAAGAGLRDSLKRQELQFDIFGGRNSLGKPSVCVVHRFDADAPAPGAAAVYCLLSAWAMNKGLLRLDLPPESFAPRGKLYVWFLRDDRVLWTETLDWPGEPKPAVTKQQ